MAPAPLGMSNGHISNDQITYSSRKNPGVTGHRARVNATNVYYSGAWTAIHEEINKWLQVDFLMSTVVTMVATQGRKDGNYWVTTYALS